MSRSKAPYMSLAAVGMMLFSLIGAKGRPSVSGGYFLSLEGTKCGFLKDVDGGGIAADVIKEPAGGQYYVKKHIGRPKYEDFTIQAGFGMNAILYDWIQKAWSMNDRPVDGSIVALDYRLQPTSERRFEQAVLTEVTIPACNGVGKEPAYLTLKFAPQVTRNTQVRGGGKDYGDLGLNEQEEWLPSNFRLEIEGLDCTGVNRIESFTVKRVAATEDLGGSRDNQKAVGKLEFPNLEIAVAEAKAQSWLDWQESFILKGNNGEKAEKNGSLTFLSPNQRAVLATIRFYNMGVFRARPYKAEDSADIVKRLQFEVYVERMEFVPGEAKGTTPRQMKLPLRKRNP